MKNKLFFRTAAGVLAVGMTAALAGCSSSADSESTAETATVETATAESSAPDESAYEYLASFSYSDGFDENGYLKGVTATDYVTLPEDSELVTDAEILVVSVAVPRIEEEPEEGEEEAAEGESAEEPAEEE